MMTPHYYSVEKKKRPSSFLTFLKNKKMYWLFSLFLLNLNFAQAQVVISEVFADGSFELRNTGSETVDISSYWICNRPSYEALSTLTIECGSLFLAAGEEVVLTTTIFGNTDDELGLYLTNNGGFSQASEIISYLEWGTAGGGRSALATGKGIWDGNAVAAFSTGESLSLSGNGAAAADWSTNTNPQECALAPPPASTSSARYQVTFNAAWSATTHPTDFPSNAHFSGLIGLTHTSNVALFELGGTASPGIINMAETGSKSPLTAEIQAIIDGGQGQNLVSGGGIGTSPGSVAVEFAIENSHPLVSITTMIAPSPDWFVGVRDLNLFENGDWLSSKTIEVVNYDAGSDSGATFASSNQATNPQGTITMITDGPLLVNGAIPSMGTLTFTRIDAVTCDAMGGTLTGGPFSFCVDGTADNIPADSIALSGNTGGNSQWVVTDTAGTILGLPASFTGPDFDAAGVGVCFVWHLSYEDSLVGLAMGKSVDSLMGCYNFSNSVQVTREVCAEACTAPSDVVVDVLSARKIRVDWEDVSNAARYIIEIRFAGNTRIVGRGLIRRSRVHIFAPSGRDYEFQIKTICADGSESPFTDWIPFSTLGNLNAAAESRNLDDFSADITIDETAIKELTVFPNPVSDLLQVNYSITSETAVMELFHVSGKKVIEKTLSNTTNNHELNMSNYANGLYLMTITENGKAPITKRIVKGSLR